jgi:hypothetical protein
MKFVEITMKCGHKEHCKDKPSIIKAHQNKRCLNCRVISVLKQGKYIR